MRNKGLYHQAQGDERRSRSEVFIELLTDSVVVEGEFVAILRSFAKQRAWINFEAYRNKLVRDGHSLHRVEAMVTKAMVGLRF